MERLVVSIALVAMTNAASTNPSFPEYKWTTQQMSYIISSAFWGMLLGMLPGTLMCRKFGVKITFAVFLLGSSIFGIITPICIPFGGWAIYCVIRIFQGIFQGIFFPCVADHLAKWSPIEERTLLGALCHSGLIIGTILAIVVSGFIAKSSLGWPGISYVTNGFGLVLCVFWVILADNSPATSRFISDEEKKFIQASQQKIEQNKEKLPIPWKQILTSGPILSLLIVHSCETWAHTSVLSQLPLYMRGVHKMEIRNNAIFSALPYMAMFLMSLVYMFTANAIIKRKLVNLTVLKKSINTLAMWIPAAALLVVGFLDSDQTVLVIVLMVVAVGFNAGATVGHGLNTIELAPNFASVLAGLMFTCVSIMAVLTPLFSGIVVTDQTDRKQWQIVFFTGAAVHFFGNLQYLFFGTTKTQAWDQADLNPKANKNIDCEKPRESVTSK